MFKIAVICGGLSNERGISLNSARSVLDHLSGDEVDILPLYVDSHRNFYEISPAQLYSNTPSDFDFKLPTSPLSQEELARFFNQIDLVFPAIHGAFGEDGELQTLLEKWDIPFVGSDSKSCQEMYNKYLAKLSLQKAGFPVVPSVLLESCQEDVIVDFFKQHSKVVVKPTCGGSSLGVFIVNHPSEAIEKTKFLLAEGHQEVFLEAYCKGKEFTIVVFENDAGEPVSLVPTEIEMEYGKDQIFDYRRKYLPTNQVTYHTPARFEKGVMDRVRKGAEEVFKLFAMRDFIRIDGWVGEDGNLYYTDINPISGLEQNSFLFRQAATVGLTHTEALSQVVKSACRRFDLNFPGYSQKKKSERLPVYVLFGARNAERQVSLMSGTNVWLKLQRSNLYQPMPFFFDGRGSVWELPYSYALDHTVEEIYENCLHAKQRSENYFSLIETIQRALRIETVLQPLPKQFSLEEFLMLAQNEQAFVFIAMHGGIGENGTLQGMLERFQILHNGSDASTSALGMDKYRAGETIRQLVDPDIFSLPKLHLCSETSFSWDQLTCELGAKQLIVKPRSEGCSAGIVLLQSEKDLQRYLSLFNENITHIPPCSFANQNEAVELSHSLEQDLIFEPYIEVDSIRIEQKRLVHTVKKGWIELTSGVLEEQGNYHGLNPSITIAEGAVLSLEEKFQGGTGVNLTPPPEEIISKKAVEKIKRGVEKIAATLGIQNYARVDLFFNCLTEKLIFIEVNTLPALTPSTVLYHQGVAEDPPLTPTALLEKFVESKMSCVLQEK